MNILIVDDEKALRSQLIKYMALEGIEADGEENGELALKALEKKSYDAVLVDLRMPVMDGLTMIKEARSKGYRMPIIMMSAHGETSDAVAALKSGAEDYIVKPFMPDELIIRLRQNIDAFKSKNYLEATVKKKDETNTFIGESAEISRIKELVLKMSASLSNVLITGESGTGKEVLARYIHSASPASAGPFIPINLAGIPENLIESELFGYEKGAFTGAVSRKAGLFELAQGGTLFLDEIGDASLSLQVKLLRVIQEKTIMHIGGNTPIPIKVRFISATNKNLEEMIKEKTFREDLYFRLNVVHFHLPPLRERGDDVVLLAKNILKHLSDVNYSSNVKLTDDAVKRLKSYAFPGNVRELENMLERAMIFASNGKIDASTLEFVGDKGGEYNVQSNIFAEKEEGSSVILSMRSAEINAIKNALTASGGNRTKAAELLGISRRTLISKIEEYAIDL